MRKDMVIISVVSAIFHVWLYLNLINPSDFDILIYTYIVTLVFAYTIKKYGRFNEK